MLCRNSHFVGGILGLLIFNIKCTFGLNACRGELIANVSLPTDLQADVLLPCSFESELLNSEKTNQTCVVWTQHTTAVTNIVEISLDGVEAFWDSRQGRIKTESKSLGFSIHIRNVQQSDLGVYHCQLFRETNCLLAYKIIELHTVSSDYLTWLIPTGAAGGAVLLLVLILITACMFCKCRKNESEQIYENTSHNQRAKFTKEDSRKNKTAPIYENTSHNQRAKFTKEDRTQKNTFQSKSIHNPIYSLNELNRNE